MKIITLSNKYFAIAVWNKLPAVLQKQISIAWSKIYRWNVSALFIKAFCHRYKIEDQQLSLYRPASGQDTYISFQDFFTRKLSQPLQVKRNSIVAPCQGFVCENGFVSELGQVNVKGRTYTIRDIFADVGNKINDTYTFINIFLHNHNYHRFHAPVSGTILNIQKISGYLNFLRPWFYAKKNVSSPSFINERYIMEILDENNQSWFLSFVGGMGVGNIKLTEGLNNGSKVNSGDELGYFLLGSTCCLAAPVKIKNFSYLQKVEVGEFL